MLAIFETIAVSLWLVKDNLFYLFNFSYIGGSLALGLTLFAGSGPRIPISIVPVGTVQTDFETEFEACGINQTRHKILLTLEATVRLVIPNGVEEVAVSSQMAVAESIIVGLVPDSFVDVNNDSEMLNLIP